MQLIHINNSFWNRLPFIFMPLVAVFFFISAIPVSGKLTGLNKSKFDLKYGIGLVKTPFSEGIKLNFFRNPAARELDKSIILKGEDESGRLLEQHNIHPQINFPEYGYILFYCRDRDQAWFRIEVNNNSNSYWVREQDGFVFVTWKQFLTDVFSIETDQASNPIRALPEDNAAAVVFRDWAVIEVTGHQGQWLQVSERFDEVGPPENHQIQTGWLKWRDEHDFLVRYNLSY